MKWENIIKLHCALTKCYFVEIHFTFNPLIHFLFKQRGTTIFNNYIQSWQCTKKREKILSAQVDEDNTDYLNTRITNPVNKEQSIPMRRKITFQCVHLKLGSKSPHDRIIDIRWQHSNKQWIKCHVKMPSCLRSKIN